MDTTVFRKGKDSWGKGGARLTGVRSVTWVGRGGREAGMGRNWEAREMTATAKKSESCEHWGAAECSGPRMMCSVSI